MRRFVVAVGAVLLMLVACASASAKAPKDPTIIARNILPSGQYGTPNPSAATQAEMYNALTPLFDHVTSNDLFTDFKSEKLGDRHRRADHRRAVPFPGVTLLRDRFNVPHVFANTRDGGIQTAGWILAEDRGLLLEQARYNSRVAVIDAPGLSAIDLTASLQTFKPSAQTEAFTATETKALKRQGKEGKAVLRDIDTYISGINAYLASSHSPNAPWTRNDVYAVNALKGQFLGQGGGDEADRSMFLNGLQQQLGRGGASRPSTTCASSRTREASPPSRARFPYGHIPRKHPGSVVIDHNSFTPDARRPREHRAQVGPQRVQASNELMVTGSHSTTGHPILVGGPQISHFFPGLVARDRHARTPPALARRHLRPVPGLPADRPHPALRHHSHLGQRRHHRPVRRDALRRQQREVPLQGQVPDDGPLRRRDAERRPGELPDHRARPGRSATRGSAGARSRSRRSARAAARTCSTSSSSGKLSNGSIKNPQDFFKAASLTPQTFNSFYIDSKHIAEYTSGRLPIRNPNVDPGLPTKGTGQFEWRGFLKADGPHARQGQQAGLPDQLEQRRGARLRSGRRRVDAERLGRPDQPPQLQPEAAAEEGKVVADVRHLGDERRGHAGRPRDRDGAAARPSCSGARPRPLSRPRRCSASCSSGAPRAATGSTSTTTALIDLPGRRDHGRRLHQHRQQRDGRAAGPVPAPRAATGSPAAGTLLRAASTTAGTSTSTATSAALLAKKRSKVPDRFSLTYCGKGQLGLCRSEVWNAIQAAGDQLTAQQGTSDPAAWRASATDEQFHYGAAAAGHLPVLEPPDGDPAGHLVQEVGTPDSISCPAR